MSKISIMVDLEMTPERLADLFWEMDADDQAKFFSTLGVIAGVDDFSTQMNSVSHSTYLNNSGSEIMDCIGRRGYELP